MECLVYSSVKNKIFSDKKTKEIVFYILKFLKKKGDVSIHFIGDTKMKKINNLYRGKKNTTDVLSFANLDKIFFEKDDELGDIFLSIPQIKRQAKKYKVSQKQEFNRMITHGLLHLLAYNHEDKKEAKKMFELQEKILKKINI